jgi:hypothetical protein
MGVSPRWVKLAGLRIVYCVLCWAIFDEFAPVPNSDALNGGCPGGAHGIVVWGVVGPVLAHGLVFWSYFQSLTVGLVIFRIGLSTGYCN